MRSLISNVRTKQVIRVRWCLCIAGVLFLVIGLGMNEVRANSQGARGGNCYAGTYLFKSASNSLSMWTFTKDGNVLATSSVQKTLNFSDMQGVWKVTGPGEISALLLDFSFNDAGEPINVARLDVVLRQASRMCDKLEGELTLHFFEDGEDPLDPSTDTGEPLRDTLEGRRLTIQ